MKKINLREKHDYWSDRFSQLEAARNETNIKKIHEIDEQFRKSLAVLDERIRAWYQRFADNNGVSPQEAYKMLNGDELDELRWTLEEYIRFGRENAEGQQWVKELENASAKVHIRRLEALKAEVQAEMEKMYHGVSDDIDQHIKRTYTDDYYKSAFELQKGTGVGHRLEALNPEKVQMIVSKPWAVDGRNFSERLWGNKEQLINTVHQILSRMVMTGNNPDRAIRELSKAYGVSKSQAGNLIMTESAVMGNLAQKKSFEEHDVEEFEVIETLDSKTCSVCGKYDGAHYPMKRFEIGVTAPPFHPRCRGCTAPYYPDRVHKGERVARDKDGNKYRVPGDMSYEEWKEKYVGGDIEGIAVAGLEESARKPPAKLAEHIPDKEKRLEIIRKGIALEKPIFTDDLVGKLAQGLPPEKNVYDVVMHGHPYYVEFFGQPIDAETLCAIIAQRKDYKKGMPIRLISCYTGSEEDGVARYIADRLGVNVFAPDKLGIISRLGNIYSIYSGSKKGQRDGVFVEFSPSKNEGVD